MENQKRFQNRKPNSDDHKNIRGAAKTIKAASMAGVFIVPVAVVIKKGGVSGIKKVGSVALKTVSRI